jgi:hypothetical protein
MRTRLLAAVAVAGLGAVADPGQASVDRCRVPSGATVVSHNATAVVWHQRTHAGGRSWFGCSAHAGQKVFLGAEGENAWTAPGRVRIAGSYVVFLSELQTVDSQRAVSLEISDLREPRYGPAGFTLGTFDASVQPPSYAITGLVVSVAGSAAWRARTSSGDVVGVADSGGHRILATEPSGTITKFRLRGKRLSWATPSAPHAYRLRGTFAPIHE